MAYSSQRSMRGWILAIGLAGVLTGVFWFMHGYSLILVPEFDSARQTPGLAEVTSKAPFNIATDSIRDERIELAVPNRTSDWLNYRSRPATSALSSIEPNASVRLAAPRVESVPSSFDLVNTPEGRRPLLPATQSESTIQPVSVGRPALSPPKPTFPPQGSYGGSHRQDTWPQPTQLIAELTHLKQLAEESSNARIAIWAAEIVSAIDQQTALPSHDPSVAATMDQLQELATKAIQAPSANLHSDLVEQLQTRVAHAVIRRIAVWKAVWDCASVPAGPRFVSTRPTFDLSRLVESIERVQLEMFSTGDVPGWVSYLLLDDLRRLSLGTDQDVQLATNTAQVVLARITSSNVDSVQRRFLDSESVRELADCLQPLAVAPVDYNALLVDLERLEEDPEHRSRSTLISAMQSLRFAYDPKQVAISQAIDTYYRNANVRIAVAATFINRLLPANKTVQRPVRQTILGAETRGNSDVNTTLKVRLNPDVSAWNLNLDLSGNIQSSTRSSRGPATFFNSSHADVATSRSIRITSQGVKVEASQADVQSQDSLRGMQTDFDGLPFIGDMVRHFAQQEFKEKRGPARRILQKTIATQTDAEFDKQLDAKLSEVEKSFEQKLIGPLRNLNLNPMVMDLQTTNERLIARYRLASDNALAANTPRPQAPSDSLLSVQIHQSAMNNGFSQLGLSDHEWTLLDLAQKLASQFGQEPIANLPEDVPSDVRIRFDGERPILVEFLDGQLSLTMRFANLRQPGRIELSDFVIKTHYVPAVSELQAELVLEGAPSVGGDRLSMREKLPLRAIFAKVFGARSTIPMVSPQLLKDSRVEGLAISQLILEDNWLAIAISEQSSPNVATLRSMQLQR